MDEVDSHSWPNITADSVREMAATLGIEPDALLEDAAKELADDVSYRLRVILQDACKFMHHGMRVKLTGNDIDHAFSSKNIKPQYGFDLPDDVPFQFSSGGGRDLGSEEDKPVDLAEMILSPVPKLPQDVTLRTHWLCVGGIQPTVPENPPPLSREAQRLESVNPIVKLSEPTNKDTRGQPLSSKAARLRAAETSVKQLATHELSVEQQLYYKEITEACVGSDETKRAEALQSLAADAGLHEMLPRVCTFISEGVKVNVVQNNLALLIYLMRMVKALLDNPSLCLEKYLHELIPSITTCILSRQLCSRPEDNHWALRDFASRLMAQICKTFNTSTNNLQTRVTRLYSRPLNKLSSEMNPLTSLYGALQGLTELGPEVIKVIIMPCLPMIGHRIMTYLESDYDFPGGHLKMAAVNIRNMLMKHLPNIIKQQYQQDLIDEYEFRYGSYFGPILLKAVTKERESPAVPAFAPIAPSPAVPQDMAVPSTSYASTSGQQDMEQRPPPQMIDPYSVRAACSSSSRDESMPGPSGLQNPVYSQSQRYLMDQYHRRTPENLQENEISSTTQPAADASPIAGFSGYIRPGPPPRYCDTDSDDDQTSNDGSSTA